MEDRVKAVEQEIVLKGIPESATPAGMQGAVTAPCPLKAPELELVQVIALPLPPWLLGTVTGPGLFSEGCPLLRRTLRERKAFSRDWEGARWVMTANQQQQTLLQIMRLLVSPCVCTAHYRGTS